MTDEALAERHRPKSERDGEDTASAAPLWEKDKRKNLPGHALPSVSGEQKVDRGGESR